MCVIIFKPKGIKIGRQTIESAWITNPDGFGLAYFEKKGVRIEKGIMCMQDCIDLIGDLQDKNLAMHFRIATSGETNPFQCHPFAVLRDPFDSKAYRAERLFKRVLFHNGIISGFGNQKYSDTLEFTIKVLSKLKDLSLQKKLLDSISGSKFLLLDHEQRKFCKIGCWKKYKGLSCSNDYFAPIKPFKSSKKAKEKASDYLWEDYYFANEEQREELLEQGYTDEDLYYLGKDRLAFED